MNRLCSEECLRETLITDALTSCEPLLSVALRDLKLAEKW